MDEPPRASVRISEPGEVAAALPALLGFVPHESLVLMALGGDSGELVRLTVRADLPAGRAAPLLARELARAVAREDPSGVLVAVVTEMPDEREPLPGAPPGEVVAGLPHRALVHDLVQAFRGLGVPVHGELLVRAGRWWSYDCSRPCCAPGAGTPLPGGVSPVAVAAIAAGVVIEADRAALGARIARVRGRAASTGAAADPVPAGPVPADQEAGADGGWEAVTGALRLCRPGSSGGVPDRQVTAVARALTDLDVRDRALGLALSDDAAAAETLWTECTRRALAPLDAAPATLLAVSAWLRGDGAMADVALERALTSRPGYRLAVLLAEGLARCLHPADLRAVIAEVAGRAG